MSDTVTFEIERTAWMCAERADERTWCNGDIDRHGRCVNNPAHVERGEADVTIELTVEGEYEGACYGYGDHPDYDACVEITSAVDEDGYEFELTRDEASKAAMKLQKYIEIVAAESRYDDGDDWYE